MSKLAHASLPSRYAFPDPLILYTLLRALSTAPSTDPQHRSTTQADGLRWRKPFKWPPAPRLQSKTRQPASLVMRRAVVLTRVTACVSRRSRREGRDRLWVTEAVGRRREGAGPASLPPQVS